MTSEFGQGFLYPLALFLCHAMELQHHVEHYAGLDKANSKQRGAEMWLYGAAEHLYEFLPDQAPTPELALRCSTFRDECLAKRLPMGGSPPITPERAAELIDEAKALFHDLDAHNGVDVVKAEWS